MFTERELELLSNGILMSIQNTNKAIKLLSGMAAEKELAEYRNELQALNSKICVMYKDSIEKEA